MKLIVGTFTAKPGRRGDYLAAARDHLEPSRLDPDCLYIELVPMPDHPDRMLLAEAFTSEAAHRRHEDTDHMRALWMVGPELLAHVVIDSVVTDDVAAHRRALRLTDPHRRPRHPARAAASGCVATKWRSVA